MSYAANTTIPVDRTQSEILRTIERYGASQNLTAEDRARRLVVWAEGEGA